MDSAEAQEPVEVVEGSKGGYLYVVVVFGVKFEGGGKYFDVLEDIGELPHVS